MGADMTNFMPGIAQQNDSFVEAIFQYTFFDRDHCSPDSIVEKITKCDSLFDNIVAIQSRSLKHVVFRVARDRFTLCLLLVFHIEDPIQCTIGSGSTKVIATFSEPLE